MLPEILSQALNTKAVILSSRRTVTKSALRSLRYALEVALEHDKPSAALRAYYNLADCIRRGSTGTRKPGTYFVTLSRLARRIGNRYWESTAAWPGVSAVRSRALGRGVHGIQPGAGGAVDRDAAIVHEPCCGRDARPCPPRAPTTTESRILDAFPDPYETSSDVQEQASLGCGKAAVLLAADQRRRGAPRPQKPRWQPVMCSAWRASSSRSAFVIDGRGRSAPSTTLPRPRSLSPPVEGLPPGRYPQFLRAQASRFRARLAHDAAERRASLQGRGGPAPRGRRALLSRRHRGWNTQSGSSGRDRSEEAEPLLAEAREIFERLECQALARARRGCRSTAGRGPGLTLLPPI